MLISGNGYRRPSVPGGAPPQICRGNTCSMQEIIAGAATIKCRLRHLCVVRHGDVVEANDMEPKVVFQS